MSLILLPPQPRKRRAGWLADHNSTELERLVVERAYDDILITEDPLGSNRGTRIDEWTKRAGLPLTKAPGSKEGHYWCAIWIGCVLADCGLKVPKDFYSCDTWLPYINRVKVPPREVGVVLYGLAKEGGRLDAHHIGLGVRKTPLILTIEGNRSLAGTASNNGVAVDGGPLTRRDILGWASLERFTA